MWAHGTYESSAWARGKWMNRLLSFSTVARGVEGSDRASRLYGVGDSKSSASAATVTLGSQQQGFASRRSSGKTR